MTAQGPAKAAGLANVTSAILLTYYGDDFTGSTDVMEALSLAGLRTVLFLKPPAPGQLAQFPELRAYGIAGGSRTMSPEEMERELPPAFTALKAAGAPIVHYKICSTFDSSPQIGSIGRAIEIGRRVFGEQRPTPLVVGAPVLGRYVVFGNLFARSGLDTEPFRLDRHPAMSRHPVTPMREADVRLLLAEQTKLPVELVDVLKLESVNDRRPVISAQLQPPIVLFDTLYEAHLPVIGREIERLADGRQLFVAGSSGVEYALVAHWRERGGAATAEEGRPGGFVHEASPRPPASAMRQLICISGSCSPVTDRQITRALEKGFVEVRVESELLAAGQYPDQAMERACNLVREGRSVIVHGTRGFDDVRLTRSLSARQQEVLCHTLGRFLERLLETTGQRRAVICGGDTSMRAARALGIEALEYLGPMAPGSPLCKVHAPGRVADGCEMVFKGGQTGRDSFFLDVLRGGPSAACSAPLS